MVAPPGTQPPLGWRLPVSNTVTLSAPMKDMLVEQVTKWRIRHGVPVGSPELDIDAFICGENPGFCHATVKDYELPPYLLDNRRFMDRLAEWISPRKDEQPVGGYRLTPESLASERVGGCAQCPRNRPMRSDCPACADIFEEAVALLRNLRPKPAGCGALACSLFGWDNYTAACLPREVIEPSEELKALAPGFCWVVKKVDNPA